MRNMHTNITNTEAAMMATVMYLKNRTITTRDRILKRELVRNIMETLTAVRIFFMVLSLVVMNWRYLSRRLMVRAMVDVAMDNH